MKTPLQIVATLFVTSVLLSQAAVAQAVPLPPPHPEHAPGTMQQHPDYRPAPPPPSPRYYRPAPPPPPPSYRGRGPGSMPPRRDYGSTPPPPPPPHRDYRPNPVPPYRR